MNHTPTLTVLQELAPLDVEVFEKSLAPLSGNEQKAIDLARAPTTTPPLPANDSDTDGSLEFAYLEGKQTSQETNATNFVCLNTDSPVGAVDKVIAYENNGSQAPFASSWLETVAAQVDYQIQILVKDDKTHYMFDIATNSIHAIVFEIQGQKMLKLNDAIIPLDTFFLMHKCMAMNQYTHGEYGVHLTFKNQESITIHAISADEIMIVLSYFHKVYPPKVTQNTEVQTMNELPPQLDPQPKKHGMHPICFVGAAAIAGVCMFVGKRLL